MIYGFISQAINHYQERGYVYMDDAPWIVGHMAYNATKPKGAKDVFYSTKDGPTLHPVASGEQSFIQMMLDGQPIKRAICVTPCHRAEPKIDTLHRPYFMKAELINAQDVDGGHLIHMIHDACAFFEHFFPVRVVETETGYDIVEKGTRFELGSYGIRDVAVNGKRLRWIYGTGCAEPRLSLAMQKHSKNTGC